MIDSHYYDLQLVVLIPANAICRNMLILSYNFKLKKCKYYIRALKFYEKTFMYQKHE